MLYSETPDMGECVSQDQGREGEGEGGGRREGEGGREGEEGGEGGGEG